MGFSQSCVCTIFILINNLPMQNELTLASEDFIACRDNTQWTRFFFHFLYHVKHMQFVRRRSPYSLTQWSTISANFRKRLLGQIGNLVGHDQWPTLISSTVPGHTKKTGHFYFMFQPVTLSLSINFGISVLLNFDVITVKLFSIVFLAFCKYFKPFSCYCVSETSRFLMLSGGAERDQWHEIFKW